MSSVLSSASCAVAVLPLAGELDLAEAPRVTDALASAAQLHPATLVVDLSGVSFCDSSGAHALREGAATLRAAGTSVVLAAPTDPVSRLLDLLRLRRDVPVCATVEDALALVELLT